MGAHFGFDFGGVRVHTDRRAAESTRAVHSLAYTVGSDIVFDTGRYDPASEKGRRLLTHELTHVVQQAGAPSRPTQQAALAGGALTVSEPDEASEREATILSLDSAPAASVLTRTTLISAPQRTVSVADPKKNIANPTGKELVQSNATTV